MDIVDLSDTSDDGVSRKHLSSRCDIKGRVYTIDLLIFVNGCFANISEDQSGKMGAISVSIKTGERATSTSLIPESKGNIFARMVGELLADKLRGIAIISLYLREELDAESMKTLINEMRKLLNKD